MQRLSNPCYTCRRRHIQCDRSQKPCLKCQRSGLECFEKRPLTWVDGVAIRGKMRGVSFKDQSTAVTPKTSVGTAKHTPSEVAQASQIMNIFELKYNARAPVSVNDWANIPPSVEDPIWLNTDRITRYYLDYYNDRICKLFIVYDSKKNPFRSLTALALDDVVLMRAIVALAARHNANNGLPFLTSDGTRSPVLLQAHSDALLFKHQALQGLSQALHAEKPCFHDTTVASVFLLIFLDLLESGSDQWNLHLEGAKRLMAMIQPRLGVEGHREVDPGRTIQGIRDFITSQIHMIETLGSTFVRPRLLSQLSSVGQQEPMRHVTVEESFLGCPEFLLNAVQCLSAQRDAIVESAADASSSLQGAIYALTNILDSVRNFNCYTWVVSQPQPSEPPLQRARKLHLLSRSYQIGATLYGECILAVAKDQSVAHDDLVDELMDAIGALKDDNDLFKCILWPIIVAALECRSQPQRMFLITCLEKFWADTSCYNVMNAAKILQDYWGSEDDHPTSPSHWVFKIGHQGHDWLLI